MALKSVAIPWLSGGLIVFGYAAFSWLRARSVRNTRPGRDAASRAVQPLSARLPRVPTELALNGDSEHLPANYALARNADLGALFLGRASEALSAVPFGPAWPEVSR